MSNKVWKKCSNCKSNIHCGEEYQVCSVTTCNNQRTGLQFCSVSCWSAHVPIARHKDAWAVEKIAPNESALEASAPLSTQATPRRIIPTSTIQQSSTPSSSANEEEILVVVSKLKKYISDRSEYSTSADVMEKLSDHLRKVCDKAIENARNSGRKTVMARDFLI